MSLVTVILDGDQTELTMSGVDLLGFEEFAAAVGREFEIAGPGVGPFVPGDRLTVTIPEYEYTSPGRVTLKRVTLNSPDGPGYNHVIRIRETA